jgi:DNA-binding NarL/FixJ family response regulator
VKVALMKLLSPVLLVCRSASLNLLWLFLLKRLGLRQVMATCKDGVELNRLIGSLSPALILFDAAFYWDSTPRRVGLLLHDRPELNIAVCNINSFQPERLVDFLRFGARSVIDLSFGVSKFRRGINRVLLNQGYTSGNVLEAYDDLPDGIPELRVDTTARQEDVKRLIWGAKKSKNIAVILGVSVKTVEIHKKALFLNYGVENCLELNRQCFLLGEIRREDVCVS